MNLRTPILIVFFAVTAAGCTNHASESNVQTPNQHAATTDKDAAGVTATPQSHPLCTLDRLNGNNIIHAASDTPLHAGQPFELTGWIVDSKHHAVDRMQFLLTPVSGEGATRFTGEVGGLRTDVAEALKTMDANLSGFAVHGDTRGLPAGHYKATAMADADGASLLCDFNITFVLQ